LLFTGVLMFLCRLGARRQIATSSAKTDPPPPSFKLCSVRIPVPTAIPST
jgi:hypothetical protein